MRPNSSFTMPNGALVCRLVAVKPGWASTLCTGLSTAVSRRWSSHPKTALANFDWL